VNTYLYAFENILIIRNNLTKKPQKLHIMRISRTHSLGGDT